MRVEKPKQIDRIKSMLRCYPRGVSNGMFAVNGILRYGSALGRLREKGWGIETIPNPDKQDKPNTWLYVLTHDPECTCEKSGRLFCGVHADHGVPDYEVD